MMSQSIGKDTEKPFDPYIWRENRRRKMDANERLRRSVLRHVREALIDVSHRYHWDAVFVFGSVIKPGKFHPSSDVDIAVKGLDKFQLYAFIADMSSFLRRDVDVVCMEECHFSESIIQRGVKWNPERANLFYSDPSFRASERSERDPESRKSK